MNLLTQTAIICGLAALISGQQGRANYPGAQSAGPVSFNIGNSPDYTIGHSREGFGGSRAGPADFGQDLGSSFSRFDRGGTGGFQTGDRMSGGPMGFGGPRGGHGGGGGGFHDDFGSRRETGRSSFSNDFGLDNSFHRDGGQGSRSSPRDRTLGTSTRSRSRSRSRGSDRSRGDGVPQFENIGGEPGFYGADGGYQGFPYMGGAGAQQAFNDGGVRMGLGNGIGTGSIGAFYHRLRTTGGRDMSMGPRGPEIPPEARMELGGGRSGSTGGSMGGGFGSGGGMGGAMGGGMGGPMGGMRGGPMGGMGGPMSGMGGPMGRMGGPMGGGMGGQMGGMGGGMGGYSGRMIGSPRFVQGIGGSPGMGMFGGRRGGRYPF